jgi:hypothetical protein
LNALGSHCRRADFSHLAAQLPEVDPRASFNSAARDAQSGICIRRDTTHGQPLAGLLQRRSWRAFPVCAAAGPYFEGFLSEVLGGIDLASSATPR